jgi:hypothetical protein
MEIGNYYENIICESFLDSETGRIRIRTIPCEAIPQSLMVESLKIFRFSYPIGTKFRAENVKITQKPLGRVHARAKDQMLYVIDNNE